jgi:hypothetical protein
MRMFRSGWLVALVVAVAAPARADVTITQKNGGSIMGQSADGESTLYIKGGRMRTDQTMGGTMQVSIVDIPNQQMIVLDPARKTAQVFDMSRLGDQLAKISGGEVTTSITPTTEKRTIAGQVCTVHDSKVTMPMKIADQTLTMSMVGPVCLAKGGPAQADFAAFYKAAAEKGFLFGNAAQGGAGSAIPKMYAEMARLGVPYATEMNMAVEGTGPMAQMMSQMGGMSMTTEVVSVSAAPLAESLFQVPDGYTVTKQ